jgi:hypothetical protein
MSTGTGTAGGPDGFTHYAIADIEAIAKAVIRAARHADRWPAWDAYKAAVKDAAASSAEFPWQEAEEITSVTAASAKDVLSAVICAVPDPAERKRLSMVMAGEAEKAEARMAAGQGSHPGIPLSVLKCAWCGKPIPAARGPLARYCTNSHRVTAHKARKRQQATQAASAGR